MFKRKEIPQTNTEKAEYLEHLDALERAYNRNRLSKKNLVILAFFFALFLFTLLAGIGVLMCLAFMSVILFIAYNMFHAQKALQKIAQLKQRLEVTTKD